MSYRIAAALREKRHVLPTASVTSKGPVKLSSLQTLTTVTKANRTKNQYVKEERKTDADKTGEKDVKSKNEEPAKDSNAADLSTKEPATPPKEPPKAAEPNGSSSAIPHGLISNFNSSNMAQSMVRRWDGASRSGRIGILTDFIARCKTLTATEIEHALGPASMLFFTRITAWLRLTYQLGFELSIQLTAISLLLQSPQFLSHFAEIGGVQMTTDILCYARHPDDTRNAILLLIHVANSGRVYRELVCSDEGVELIVKAAAKENDRHTLELFTSLFLSLGQGNPRRAMLIHSGLLYLILNGSEAVALAAATTLRALQLARDQSAQRSFATLGGAKEGVEAYATHEFDKGGNVTIVGIENGSPESAAVLLDALFHLVESDSVKLRFEGTELLALASRNRSLVIPILDRCLEVLDARPKNFNVTAAEAPKPSNDASESAAAESARNRFGDKYPSMPPPTQTVPQEVLKLRRLQISCGRVLCSIMLSPNPSSVVLKLCNFIEQRSGHLSILNYLELTAGRDSSVLEECCRVLRLLSTSPLLQQAGDAGAIGLPGNSGSAAAMASPAAVSSSSQNDAVFEMLLERSRTARYLESLLGPELLRAVLAGPSMTRTQVLAMARALRESSDAMHNDEEEEELDEEQAENDTGANKE